jgi:hypothetical protein
VPVLNWYPGFAGPIGAGNSSSAYWLVFDTHGSYGRVVFVARTDGAALGHINWPIPRVPEPGAVGPNRITLRAQHMSEHDRLAFLSSVMYVDVPTFVTLAQARSRVRSIDRRALAAPGAPLAIHAALSGSIANALNYSATFGPALGVTIYGPPAVPGMLCDARSNDSAVIGGWVATGATRVSILADGHVVAHGEPAHDPRVPGSALFDASVSHQSQVRTITVRSDTGSYSFSLSACVND